MGGCFAALKTELSMERLDYDDFNKGEWITVFGASSNQRCMQNPYVYSAFELFEAVAVSAIWFWALYEDVIADDAPCEGGKFFIFLTYWSLTAQVFYVWVAWFVTFRANAMAEGWVRRRETMPWYAIATWVLQDILVPTSFMVFVLYFVLVVDWEDPPELGKSYFTHGANFALMILDVFFSRQPYYLLHGIYFGALSIIYVLFTYVYYKAGGTNCKGDPYIYTAFDWSGDETQTLAAILVFIIAPIVNFFFWLLISQFFPARSKTPVVEMA